jgi:rubredoxin
MTKECLICHKTFESKSALKQHTGTKYATLRKSHVCPDCERPFCSEGSMETHRNAPSHRNMFGCGVCKKVFRSKHAVSQHEKSGAHERMGVIGKLPSLTPVHANTSSDKVRSDKVRSDKVRL